MNPITIAIQQLHYKIPEPILREAFRDKTQGFYTGPMYGFPESIDSRINNLVVKPRVLLDANLVGGQHAIIPLDGLMPVYSDIVNTVFEVPKDRTNNLSILSVLSAGYLPQWYFSNTSLTNTSSCGYSDTSTTIQRIYDSMASIPPISNAYVQLTGENTVLIRVVSPTQLTYFIRCVLSNDPNLNNIKPRSIPAFSKLVELAVKSYIYNSLIITMDQAYLQGGQELGAFKNIVEGYSDAEEMYQTYLRETWSPTAFANDVHAYDRFIRLQISPGL